MVPLISATQKSPRESPFFCNTHPDFVRELASSAVDRIFMPGDCVVNEGPMGGGWIALHLDKFPGEKIKLPWPGPIWKGDEMMRKMPG